MNDDRGKLHKHSDGTVHRHFSQGFTIGGQVIADDDGSGKHGHGSMSLRDSEQNVTPTMETPVLVEEIHSHEFNRPEHGYSGVEQLRGHLLHDHKLPERAWRYIENMAHKQDHGKEE